MSLSDLIGFYSNCSCILENESLEVPVVPPRVGVCVCVRDICKPLCGSYVFLIMYTYCTCTWHVLCMYKCGL